MPIRALQSICLLVLASAVATAQPTKVAIIGLVHGHSWAHLKDVLHNPAVELVGVSEPNPALRQIAEKMGISHQLFFADYTQMLDQVKPDLVWTFVENNRHLEIAHACAARSIHVLFEKPLASTYADARAIRDLAARSGIYVLTNYQMAWWPSNTAAQKIAADGSLGEIFRLHGIVGHGGPGSDGPANHAFFEWLTDPVQNGGGALVDFGCYSAAWALLYLGRPETVYARADHLRPERFPKVEDNAAVMLGYKKANMLIEASWDLPRSYQDLEVLGRTGSLYMTEKGIELTRGRSGSQSAPVPPLPPEQGSPLASMLNSIKTHQAPAGIVGLDLNVGVMEIVEAAKESVQTGQVVRLPEAPVP